MLRQNHEKITNLLKEKKVIGEGKDLKQHIFNQRFLWKLLSDFLSSDKPIVLPREASLLINLRNMLMDHTYSGWLFKDILDKWVRDYVNKEYNLYAIKLFSHYSQISPQLSEEINYLYKYFGEIKIFPILFKQEFKCKLFNDDMTVNTPAATYLHGVAGDIVRTYKITPHSPAQNNVSAVQQAPLVMSEDEEGELHIEMAYVLKELLEPYLLELDLDRRDDPAQIFKLHLNSLKYPHPALLQLRDQPEEELLTYLQELANKPSEELEPHLCKLQQDLKKTCAEYSIHQWDATNDIQPTIENDPSIPSDEKAIAIWTWGAKCARVQQQMLDSLQALQTVKAMSLHVGYDPALKRSRPPLPAPKKRHVEPNKEDNWRRSWF